MRPQKLEVNAIIPSTETQPLTSPSLQPDVSSKYKVRYNIQEVIHHYTAQGCIMNVYKHLHATQTTQHLVTV